MVLVKNRGYEPTDALKKELQNHVKQVTAPYKYPRIVEFVDELPKTVSGKIQRSRSAMAISRPIADALITGKVCLHRMHNALAHRSGRGFLPAMAGRKSRLFHILGVPSFAWKGGLLFVVFPA